MDVTTNETKAALAIPPGLHWSEIDLYVVYLALTNPKPRVFEDLLLEHTLFRTNLDVYRRTTKFANELRNKIGLELSRTTSARLARTWYVWAEEMSENKRPVEFLGHNIVDLLGHVVRARLAERCTELGTGTDRIGNRVSSFPGASLDHTFTACWRATIGAQLRTFCWVMCSCRMGSTPTAAARDVGTRSIASRRTSGSNCMSGGRLQRPGRSGQRQLLRSR